MIYDVRQSTVYNYASPVAYAHHMLRLTPINREHQRVHATALDIEPTPIERREGQDFFGNRITWITFDQPHDTLTIRVAARIAVERGAPPKPISDACLGGRPRLGFRLRRSVAAGAVALSVPEPAGLARSGNLRLRGLELSRRTDGPRRRGRSDEPHQGRIRL